MYKKERGRDIKMQIKRELRGKKKTASRQSIDEVSVEGRRYDEAQKQRTIYHKGKAKERLSTAGTSGDILVKNSRQGHLKWEQK